MGTLFFDKGNSNKTLNISEKNQGWEKFFKTAKQL